MSIERIVVVGAGTMGNGIAHVAALHGTTTTLMDVDALALERALASIDRNLDRQVTKGLVDAAEKSAALGRIVTSQDLDTAAAKADLVIEAAPERAELKYTIFETIDRAAPRGAILASNTSSISITEIAARTSRPEDVIGMHFMNPVPVMQLVEVI